MLTSSCKADIFCSLNSVFSSVGRFASEEVILSLLSHKCLPSLLYAVEACPISSRDKHSLDFTVTRVFMKMFRTGSPGIVEECQRFFNFLPVRFRTEIKTAKFLQKFAASENYVCRPFEKKAQRQLCDLFSKYGLPQSSSIAYLIKSIYKSFHTPK